MQIINCEQGSEEWLNMRLGKLTASKFSEVISKGTGRATYMKQLAAELITGIRQDTFKNKAMEWGNEHEDQARATYELETFNTVSQIGFVIVNDFCGVSPDGLVGNDGLIEIKCPNTTTHIETVLRKKMPTKHKAQVQGQLWATNRAWCDFVSFDPRIQGEKSFFCTRIDRDDKYINETLEPAINAFIDELKAMVGVFKEAA